jgi:PAS domain S-box-containing protein
MAGLRREAAEREREAHTRAILEGALEAVVAMDAGGRVTFWNPQAERTFGRGRDEAMGRVFVDLVLPQPRREEHAQETGDSPVERVQDPQELFARRELVARRSGEIWIVGDVERVHLQRRYHR